MGKNNGNVFLRETRDLINKKATRKLKEFPSGSVLFTKSGASTLLNQRAILANDSFVVSHIAASIPFTGISSKWLYYWLTLIDFATLAHATNMPSLPLSRAKNIEVPLAPVAQQERIVAKIEELFSELDKGIDSLKTAREQLKIYRQAVLKHAFEGKLTEQWREENKDKLETADQLLACIKQEREARYQQQLADWKAAVKTWAASGSRGKKPSKPRKKHSIDIENVLLPELPEGWAWECLGNLNADVFDGPFGSNLKTSDYVDRGVRIIRLENVGYLEFIEEKYSYVTEEKYETIKKHTVQAGDIVFSSFITDGIRIVILPETIKRAVNKADCFCVRLHGETVGNDYLANFLLTRAAYKQVESEIHGIGRPRINTTQLKSFVVPICSHEEQEQIMSRVSDQLSLADHVGMTIECEMERCEALRQSILKKAFSGQLVEQDQNDEPASVLLERVKGTKAGQGKTKRSAA